jgi:hypothetical protein
MITATGHPGVRCHQRSWTIRLTGRRALFVRIRPVVKDEGVIGDGLAFGLSLRGFGDGILFPRKVGEVFDHFDEPPPQVAIGNRRVLQPSP